MVKCVCSQKNKLINYTELDKIYNTLVQQDNCLKWKQLETYLSQASLGLNTDKNLLSGDQREFSQLCLARVALPGAAIRVYHKNKDLQNCEIISPTVPVES